MNFPDALLGSLPPFTATGVLPPGDYAPEASEFEVRFVDIGESAIRKRIYSGWIRLRQALLSVGQAVSARHLLDGSYTTSKPSPGDLDVAVELAITGEEYEQLLRSHGHPALPLLAGPGSKPQYDCDAYPILVLPRDHPDYPTVTAEAIRYWVKWFGAARDGSEKGRVWATTGGFR